ncbi:MAG TPA: response regulator [Clostridia bacterium]|nr:response regulator [Clostridia bacterium]
MGLKVLLVDDEEAIRELLLAVLEREDYEVQTCSCAADAKIAVERETFDIVVTDMRMETPTAGFEVVRAVKASNVRTVVALLTAMPIPPGDWKMAGADALFVKGESVLRLPQVLSELLLARPVRVANLYAGERDVL